MSEMLTTVSDSELPIIDRAVLVEPAGMNSAVVKQLVWYQGGRHLQTEVHFASLGEALEYASKLYRDEDSEL